MPDRYEVLASETTLQLLSDTQTETVQQFTAQSTRSGAIFTVRLPFVGEKDAGWWTLAKQYLEGRAAYLDILMEMPEVESANIVQDVNAANMLSDSLMVTVQSSNGRLTSQLPAIPFPADLGDVQDEIRAQAAQLDSFVTGG